MTFSRLLTAACCAGLTLLPQAAAAQSAADLLPRGTDLQTDPSREVTPPREPSPPEAVIPGLTGADGPLVLEGIRLTGAETLSAQELQPIWAELIGEPVGLAELEAVAEEIGAAYRAEGYILSQAVLPAQSVADGIVEIVVVEGFVDRVEIAAEKPRVQETTDRLFRPCRRTARCAWKRSSARCSSRVTPMARMWKPCSSPRPEPSGRRISASP